MSPLNNFPGARKSLIDCGTAMDSFFLIVAKPLIQGSPTIKLRELLNCDEIADKFKGLPHTAEAQSQSRRWRYSS